MRTWWQGGVQLQPHSYMAVIVCVALALRLIGLTTADFTLDEIYTLNFARLSLAQIIQAIVDWDAHPPLYYALMHGWTAWLGESATVLRLPSVLFSVGSVYLIYRVGDQLFNRYVGLVAALLLACSPFDIEQAQLARMYSLLSLVSLWSMYMLLCLLRAPSIGRWVLYALSALFLLYTHIYGLFILLAQNFHVLFLLHRDRNRNRNSHHLESLFTFRYWVLCQCVIVALVTPWLYILINRVLQLQQIGFWIDKPGLRTLAATLVAYSGHRGVLFVWVILAGLGLFSMYERAGPGRRFRLREHRVRGIALIMVLLLVVNVLPFLMSQVSTPMYLARYTMGAYFAFMLLVVIGSEKLRPRALQVACIGLLVIFSLVSLSGARNPVNRSPQISASIDFLQQQGVGIHRQGLIKPGPIQPGQWPIILCGDLHLTYPFLYYASLAGLDSPIEVTPSAREAMALDWAPWLQAELQAHRALAGSRGGASQGGPVASPVGGSLADLAAAGQKLWFVTLAEHSPRCLPIDAELEGQYNAIERHAGYRDLELLLVEKLNTASAP